MTRVLHVTDVYLPQVGGIEIFVADLAGRQAAFGDDVVVLAATPSQEVVGTPVDFAVLRPRLQTPKATWLADARRLAASGDFDVVHAHLSVVSPFATLVAQAAVRAGVPTVATVHSIWGGRTPVVRAVGAVVGWARWSIVWTAVSSVAAKDVRATLSRTASVVVVPNAVDVEWWRGSAEPIATRYRSRPLTLVTVGRLVGRKRPRPLVRALGQIRALVPANVALRAVLVGAGPQERSLRADIDRQGLDGWVSMAGNRSHDQLRDLYQHADLYISPARQESFGIAALEARAAGLPVIAMASGGVGEFITHGVDGLLCSDDDELAHAVADLALAPDRLAAMALRTRSHPPMVSWSQTLQLFAAAYQRAGAAQQASPRSSLTPHRQA